MDPERVSRTAPMCMHKPNIQQLDTRNIRCPTRKCSKPTAFPFQHQLPRVLDNGIVSKISKFADDTKLCYWSRHPDEVLELQEDLNRLVDWAKKWQMNFNADKCAVMHIGHNNIQHNYTMANQQLIAMRSRSHHNQIPQVAGTNPKEL